MKIILTPIALCVLGCQLQAQVSFTLSSSPEVGNFPAMVTTADVNGDGKVDLVCANQFDNNISVLTNNGNGGFVTAATYATGAGPNSVATADVNGDGKVDLIVANMNANTLSVLTNDGNGGFVTAANLATGAHPFSVTATDVNGDGKPDLISANYNDNTLTVLTNNGMGGFVTAGTYAVGGNPFTITAADVNGDGKPDLISANSGGNSLSVLTNDGTGNFVLAGTYAVGSGPTWVTTADVNGDGKPDLICTSDVGNSLSVLTNNGSGGFVISGTYKVSNGPIGPICVSAADINGDGKVDLISANGDDSTLTVLTNNDSGDFVLAGKYTVGSQAYGVVAADVNGDGRVDMISANAWNGSLTVLTNATPFPQTTPSCDPAPSGLISWWPGEGNANDIVGGNNGNPTGGITYAAGKVGQSFVFNGSTSYIPVPASPSLDIGATGSGITIEGWIKPNQLGPVGAAGLPIVEWDSASNDALQLWVNAGFTLFANIKDTGNNPHVIQSAPNSINTNNLQHVALTYDKSSGAALLYINGAMAVSNNFGNLTPLTTYPLNIGRRTGQPIGNGSTFNGLIDELSLYNRALSASEIAAIYDADSAGKCPQAQTPPVITTQPSNQTVTVGNTAIFSVVASGSTPLNFQWSLNTTNINGATNATLTLNNVQFTQAGNYIVLVANSAGSTNSVPAALTINPPPPCDPPPSGLISWWPGEGNANDIVGGNNGIPTGGVAYAAGPVGQSFVFNGSTSYIPVPASPSLDIGATGSGITIEGWINPVSSDENAPIVEWDSPSTDGLQFWINTPMRLFANFRGVGGGGNGYLIYSANGVVATNVWQHVALTYDKTSGVTVIYLNGNVLVATNLGSFTPQTTYPMNIGRRTGQPIGLNDTFNGGIDELSLYNRALSAAEIAAIYNAGSAGKCPPTPTLPVPVITSFSPQSGTNGTVVTISGANFSSLASSNIVYFGAVQANVLTASPTSLQVTVPVGATFAPITVTVNGLTAYSDQPFLPTFAGGGLVSFTLSSSPEVGNFPAMVTTADVNGDGKVDLVCANQFDNNISVLTNNGNGGFVTAATYATGAGPNSVATADVNGDGKVDLIVANMNANTLSVLTNDGNGGFVTAANLATGAHPFSVTATDVNGDGKPDLISANYNDNTLTVLTNNGMGGFVTAGTYAVGGNPFTITAADVNGDGKPDLISANSGGNSLSVLTNDGTGNFVLAGTYAVGSGPTWVTTADVNGDGKPDLICTSDVGNSLSVLTNNGSGGFVISGTYKVSNGPIGPICVSAADINGDGKVDLISANGDDSTLTVLTNNDSGDFVLAGKYTVGSQAYGVVAADVNGDGRVDMISANAWNGSLTVLTNASIVAPPVADATATVSLVISVNNSNATVVLNGSLSYDLDGDPLTYTWYQTGSPNPLATGVIAVVVLPVGTNSITLMVSDGLASSQQAITVQVITLAQAVDQLEAVVNTNVSKAQPLIATLNAALGAIDRSDPKAAINQLQAFQNKISAQISPLDPALAQSLIDEAQSIINALSAGGTASHNALKATAQANGKMHLNFSGIHQQVYIIEASTNMVDWQMIGVAQDQGDGTFNFDDAQSKQMPARYYRVVVP